MPAWLTHLGNYVRHEVVECVTSVHAHHWLSKLGADVRDALVKTAVAGVAKSAWAKRSKLFAVFKKSRSLSTSAQRTYSVGISFSQPTPTPVNITGGSIVQVAGFTPPTQVEGFSISQTR